MKRQGTLSRQPEIVHNSHGSASRGQSVSKLDLLAIDRAFAELGPDTPLCDVVSMAQSIKDAIILSHARSKQEHRC